MKFTGKKYYTKVEKKELHFPANATKEDILKCVDELHDAEILLKEFHEGTCRFLDPESWVVHVKHTKYYHTEEYDRFLEYQAEMRAERGPSCEDWGCPYDTESGVPFQLQEDLRYGGR